MESTVFSRPDCNPCAKVKTWLNNKNVNYREVDVSKDVQGLNTLKDLGYTSVPVILAGNGHWSGINLDKMKELTR